MKLQLAGKVAVTFIVPALTSVTVTVFPAMMPHGFEHSSEFCAAVKVAALPLAGAPTLRARAHPAAASVPVSFHFIIASLVWLTLIRTPQSGVRPSHSEALLGRPVKQHFLDAMRSCATFFLGQNAPLVRLLLTHLPRVEHRSGGPAGALFVDGAA